MPTGTPSGHVHWENNYQPSFIVELNMPTYISLAVQTTITRRFCLVALEYNLYGGTFERVIESTLIFLTRQVRHPVLLRVYLGRFLCAWSCGGIGDGMW